MLVKIGDCFVEPSEIAMVVDSYDSHVEVKPMICIHLRCGSSHWIHSTMDEAEAVLIDAGVIENPYPEDEDEPPELTEDERSELAALDAQGYECIARDIDGKLYAYKGEPGREGGYYYAPGATAPEKVAGDFLFVDADEVWSIAFLRGE